MDQDLYQVDVFTDRYFHGNPAGVCILQGPASVDWMQDVAAEMNLSETAFLYPEGEGFRLRWFTPQTEVDLCGHATVGSAHVLWETESLPRSRRIRFFTNSGELTAEWDNGSITVDFPAIPTVEADPPDGLMEALGVAGEWFGMGDQHYLVQVRSETDVRSARPDYTALARVADRPVILSSRASSPQYDIVSRFFAPCIGINEDPVTGFAHCCLGPFWGVRLGRNTICAHQASTRTGDVFVTLRENRVLLTGNALTVFRIKLLPDVASTNSPVAENGV
ncbi:MAG TPA: PhzF family phenazine biosynthesis protein [Acidobacteriota bacterium]|nr:PhzF family phenazine biosynthesis protein [Acidobacteriota bacterium]